MPECFRKEFLVKRASYERVQRAITFFSYCLLRVYSLNVNTKGMYKTIMYLLRPRDGAPEADMEP